jgi:hypothetical protein
MGPTRTMHCRRLLLLLHSPQLLRLYERVLPLLLLLLQLPCPLVTVLLRQIAARLATPVGPQLLWW